MIISPLLIAFDLFSACLNFVLCVLITLLGLNCHFLLPLKLLGQLVLHFLVFHVSILMLFIEDHIPFSLSFFILLLNVVSAVEIGGHLGRRKPRVQMTFHTLVNLRCLAQIIGVASSSAHHRHVAHILLAAKCLESRFQHALVVRHRQATTL